MSDIEESNDFCSTNMEMLDYDEFDYNLLFRALDNIRVITKEYLEGSKTETNTKETYDRIKREYSLYACKVKPQIQNSKDRKSTVRGLFKFLIFVLTSSYCIWLLYQIYKVLFAKKHKISMLYAMIILLLINPLYSVITITVEMLKYRASNQMHSSKKQIIDDIERDISYCVTCEKNFTIPNICKYYKYFDREESGNKLCDKHCKECEDNTVKNTELMVDSISNKMDKLDNIHQFFENQKKFVLKSQNPFIEIKENDIVNSLIDFLLGKNIESTLRENLNNSEDSEELVFENSQQVRDNVVNMLKFQEGYAYEKSGIVSDYNTYFVTDVNNLLYELTVDVLSFLSDAGMRRRYFDSNKHITGFIKNDNNLVLYCHNYKNDNTYKECNSDTTTEPITEPIGTMDSICDKMYKLIVRLRRLNILWLPEYEHLRKLIFDKTDIQIQKSIYRAKMASDLKILLSEIIAIVMNNDKLVEISENSVFTKANEFNDMILLECYENNCDSSSKTFTERKHIRMKYYVDNVENKIDILDFYPKDFATSDTLLFTKCKTFIYSLSQNTLPRSFQQTFRIETLMVKNIILNSLENIPVNMKRMVSYIQTFLREKKVLPQEKELVFIANASALIKYSIGKKSQMEKNNELFFNAKNEIEYPNKYISFDEFNVKLLNLEKYQFNKYSKSINDAQRDIVFFIDKIDEINNRMETKFQMTSYYKQYITIYIMVSLLILIDIVWKDYFGQDFNFSYMDKVKKTTEDLKKTSGEFFQNINKGIAKKKRIVKNNINI